MYQLVPRLATCYPVWIPSQSSRNKTDLPEALDCANRQNSRAIDLNPILALWATLSRNKLTLRTAC